MSDINQDLNMNDDVLASLLGVYAAEFGSYTTLLWQVPALCLTAQSFLMTIILNGGINDFQRGLAAVLSIAITVSCMFLMHSHRGRARNQEHMSRLVSEKLQLEKIFGSWQGRDFNPSHANAVTIWKTNRGMYGLWDGTLILFAVADVIAIVLSVLHPSWWT
jgi:hypothetical protein